MYYISHCLTKKVKQLMLVISIIGENFIANSFKRVLYSSIKYIDYYNIY